MSLSLSGDGTVTGVTAIGDVSSTELGYLDGVTSGLQTQINTKADASTQGLVLIDEESFSAVSSVSLNNVFSATYDNYRIVTEFVASTAGDLLMRLRLSGTDNTSSVYYGGTFRTAANNTSGILYADDPNSFFVIVKSGTSHSQYSQDVYSPAVAVNTCLTTLSNMSLSGVGRIFAFGGGQHAVATAYDGFTIYPSAGTITGTIRVYGYKGA